MVNEPLDAPVPDHAKKKYYVGLAIAVVVGLALAFFVLPNLLFLADEGPAVEDGFQVTVPSDDGLQRTDPVD